MPVYETRKLFHNKNARQNVVHKINNAFPGCTDHVMVVMVDGQTLLGTRVDPDVVPGFSPFPSKPPAPPQAQTGPCDVCWQGS